MKKPRTTKQEIIAKYKTREAFRQSEQYRLQRDNLLADNFLKHLTLQMSVDPENTQFLLYWIRNHSKAELVDQIRTAEKKKHLEKIFSYDTGDFIESLRQLVLQMYNIPEIKEVYISRARTPQGRKKIHTDTFENKEIRKQIKEFKYKPEYIKKKKAFRAYISRHLDLGKSSYEYVKLSDFDTPEIKKERKERTRRLKEAFDLSRRLLDF